MVEPTDAELDAAADRGRMLDRGPLASAVRYDERSGRIVIDLTNGSVFAFPPALAQGLGAASPDQLDDVTISGGGYGLHWEALDVDLTVPGLVAGVFGTRAWMASQAGRATSPAKAAAARANGAKGGRPRRTAAA